MRVHSKRESSDQTWHHQKQWQSQWSRKEALTATNLPIIIWYQAVSAEICITKPMAQMIHHKDTESLRPTLSAIGAAIRAPIRVPIDKRATINPDLTVLK